MAILKQTYVSGNLFVTESNTFVSASEFRGTASWAVTASHALNAVSASAIDPDADLFVKSLHVSGNAQIDGDLKVLGDLTYVGVQDLRVKDHVIEINSDDSGSAQGSANGAGVVIKNSDAAGNIELIYSASDDKLHINKQIAGTVDNADQATSASRADSAASADEAAKVAHKLTFGAGISKSVATFDGSEEVVIDVNTSAIEQVTVSQSISASHAAVAEAVEEDLTFVVTASGGTVTSDTYNGSAAKTFSVDLSPFETKEEASQSHANLQAQIDAIIDPSGSGTGSLDERITAAVNALDADADAQASGTAVSGGVFVLSGVAFNEADGKLTSGSATSVEVEKAGEAAKAKAELLGAASDATSSMTLNGIKNYVDAKTGDGVAALSESVATDFSASNAARVALSQSVSQSIADVAANALNLVESSSYIAVSEKANNKQTISAKTQAVATADATSANGLALAADVKDYVDSQVTSKNVDAEGDDWVAASAANNKVTVTTNVKAIADATAQDDGLAAASDVKAHVSASVAALSSSVATKDAAQDARLDALEAASGSAISRLDAIEAATASYALATDVAASESADRARLDALEAASGSAITRLDALETASATHVTNETFNSYTSSAAATASALEDRIETLETASAATDDKYVLKAGDTMSGDLNMATNGIVFGNMKIVWNATDQAIEFVANE